MNEVPLISVIIPVYKAENTLGYCMDSVLKQSYKNLEVILVEDGSPDRSGELCDEYAARDCRVKVIHKKNGGVSDARNAGLCLANGAWIMFVDSDDVLPEHSIRNLIAASLDQNADIIQGKTVLIQNYEQVKAHYETSDKRIVFMPEELAATSAGGYRASVCGKLYKSSLAKKHRFPVGLYNEDTYYNGLILSDNSIQKIIVIDEISYFYLENQDSVSHNWDIDHYSDMERAIEKLYITIKANSNNPNIVQSYLLLFFSHYANIKYNIIIRNQYHGELKKRFISDRKKYIPDLLHSSIPASKKVAYYFVTLSNPLYRLYVFHSDPTMRVYEKNVRSRNMGKKNSGA